MIWLVRTRVTFFVEYIMLPKKGWFCGSSMDSSRVEMNCWT